jgi:hypothetical protein
MGYIETLLQKKRNNMTANYCKALLFGSSSKRHAERQNKSDTKRGLLGKENVLIGPQQPC